MVRGHGSLIRTAWSALALGALCSAGLAGSIGAGWKQGIPFHAAWALFPYMALAVSLALGRVFHAGRPVQRFLAWITVVVGLGGPLLYLYAMLVRVDAQGALAALMIPIQQTAASVVAAAVAVIWQWSES